jgi:S1-C subfamily serine protease
MAHNTLTSFSDELAGVVAAGAAAVVQVHGARRPGSGVVHGPDTVITMARAIGREDGLRVRLPGADPIDAELAGWDPASGIAVLRARTALNLTPAGVAPNEPRTGEIAVAIARSFSNGVTSSVGNVAIVGGPLRTRGRLEVARVIRVTAPMHDGFAGGGVFDASGRLVAIATAATIRGFGVAIPASIAWDAAAGVLESGSPRRGFVGIAVHVAHLPPAQRPEGRERGLLVVSVTPSSPAEAAGVMVGDVLLDFDGHATEDPDDLLDLLTQGRVGRLVATRTLRGGVVREIQISVTERPR